MKSLTVIMLLMAFSAVAQEKRNTRFEYKKLEKFDFDEIGVEGEAGAPGDISVSPRLRNEFKNKVPERRSFNPEMKKAIEGIR